jgi:hypothetical protein
MMASIRAVLSHRFSTAILVLALAALSWWLLLPRQSELGRRGARAHPMIFHEGASCAVSRGLELRARRTERQARLYMERYPYDPLDGVRAVHRLREAEHCYRSGSLPHAAERVARMAAKFQGRVETDYASSRLVLRSALQNERWGVAYTEAKRLLRLTAGARDHAYVRWLTEVAGKAAVHARTSP